MQFQTNFNSFNLTHQTSPRITRSSINILGFDLKHHIFKNSFFPSNVIIEWSNQDILDEIQKVWKYLTSSKLTFTYLKSAIETLEKGVKYVQS